MWKGRREVGGKELFLFCVCCCVGVVFGCVGYRRCGGGLIVGWEGRGFGGKGSGLWGILFWEKWWFFGLFEFGIGILILCIGRCGLGMVEWVNGGGLVCCGVYLCGVDGVCCEMDVLELVGIFGLI